MGQSQYNLYEQIRETIVRPYLGEKSERFLSRQCRAHIHIEAKDLANSHLPALARWVEASAALLVSMDSAIAMRRKIEALVSREYTA
jgi:hypothetical protein